MLSIIYIKYYRIYDFERLWAFNKNLVFFQVLRSPNADITTVTIQGGAHHLDLRAQNPADPISVQAAREVEKQAIRKWINS